MGRRGPPPKPTDLKVIEGTYRADRAPKNEPRPAAKVPTAPSWLAPEAKKEWKRITKELAKVKLITELDRTPLALYCQAIAEYLAAIDEIEDNGGATTESAKGTLIAHPAVAMRNNAWSRALKAAAEFGMTPSARTRISVDAGSEEKPGNPFMTLHRGTG